jgi:hypothetical protein
MEPVISSSAGACFAPLLIFRSANMLNTKITVATTLSRVLRLGVSQGTAKRFRIGRTPKAERRVLPLAPDGKGNLTALPLNKFLGINLEPEKISQSIRLSFGFCTKQKGRCRLHCGVSARRSHSWPTSGIPTVGSKQVECTEARELGSTSNARERHGLFRCGAFLAARSRCPSIQKCSELSPPEHLGTANIPPFR